LPFGCCWDTVSHLVTTRDRDRLGRDHAFTVHILMRPRPMSEHLGAPSRGQQRCDPHTMLAFMLCDLILFWTIITLPHPVLSFIFHHSLCRQSASQNTHSYTAQYIYTHIHQPAPSRPFPSPYGTQPTTPTTPLTPCRCPRCRAPPSAPPPRPWPWWRRRRQRPRRRWATAGTDGHAPESVIVVCV
jgi:hypothetical protein